MARIVNIQEISDEYGDIEALTDMVADAGKELRPDEVMVRDGGERDGTGGSPI